jgi:lysosomal alpha-mannosidase
VEIAANLEAVEEDPHTIYFHVVCHSHDDVGWLNTPEEYFDERVNTIISTVVQALVDNPERKFSQTEIYYFERWWRRQNDTTISNVRKIIKRG